jgi:drug/metabolite transporter (DMT)-like permease
MLKSIYYPYLELGIGLLCISSSGVLGKYIDLPPEITIWARCLVAGIFLLMINKLMGTSYKFDFKKHGKILLISSICMALHWVTYFYALQYSTVAIGMLSLFTFPVITSFLEPLYFKQKIQTYQLGLAILVIIGLTLLLPSGNISSSIWLGIGFGVTSAFVFSIRNILVKSLTYQYSGSLIMTYQLIISIIVLSPFLLIRSTTNLETYWPYLIVLGIVTTAIGHTLFARGFKTFTATTTSIFGSLQPVLGIFMAYLFLSESVNLQTFIGGFIILSTVLVEGFLVIKNSG